METFYKHKLRRYLGTDGGLDSILEYLQQEVSCRRVHLTHCLHVCRVYA